MGRLRTVSASATFSEKELTVETIEGVVQTMQACMADLQAAWLAVARHQVQTSVRYKRCIYSMFEQVGRTRDFIDTVIAADTGGGHPLLKELFGGDCRHLASIQCCIETLSPLLEGSNMAEDARLLQCRRACESVKSILADAGLSGRLARALTEAEAAAVEDAAAEAAPGAAAPEESEENSVGHVRSFEARPPVTRPRSMSVVEQEARAKMLEDIDATSTAETVVPLIDELFDKYDSDGNGLLEDEEYTAVMQDLTRHVLKEAAAVAAKYRGRRFVPPEDVLRQWVIDVVDPNRDGAITREEARVGFKKVVNDVKS